MILYDRFYLFKNWENVGEQKGEPSVKYWNQRRHSLETLKHNMRANLNAVICNKNGVEMNDIFSITVDTATNQSTCAERWAENFRKNV